MTPGALSASTKKSEATGAMTQEEGKNGGRAASEPPEADLKALLAPAARLATTMRVLAMRMQVVVQALEDRLSLASGGEGIRVWMPFEEDGESVQCVTVTYPSSDEGGEVRADTPVV